jgi:hypothetical protein
VSQTLTPGTTGWFNNFAAQNAKRITAIKPMSFNYVAKAYVTSPNNSTREYDSANMYASNVGVFASDPTFGYVSDTYSSPETLELAVSMSRLIK